MINNNNTLTLDTSVLAKAIFPPRRRKIDSIYKEQLRLHTIAKSVLKEIEDKISVMCIPSVAIIEIAAVGARLTGKEIRGIQASDYIKEQGDIYYDLRLLDESVKVAATTMASGFDSVFITCAKITNSTLITDDRGMYRAAQGIGIKAKLLRDMTL